MRTSSSRCRNTSHKAHKAVPREKVLPALGPHQLAGQYALGPCGATLGQPVGTSSMDGWRSSSTSHPSRTRERRWGPELGIWNFKSMLQSKTNQKKHCVIVSLFFIVNSQFEVSGRKGLVPLGESQKCHSTLWSAFPVSTGSAKVLIISTVQKATVTAQPQHTVFFLFVSFNCYK